MAFDYHSDRQLTFEYQVQNTTNYIIPFIESSLNVNEGMKVLEIGCGEGGVLKAFVKRGCICTGVDLHEYKLQLAEEYLKEDINAGKLRFIFKDIYDLVDDEGFNSRFDLVLLKDTLEHIHNQERLIRELKKLLNKNGHIYFGFPPWHMPFGGHQQVCSSKLLSVLPYFHLLPDPVYTGILKIFGEEKDTIDFLLETKETRITPARFERIIESEGYEIAARKFYLINPMYLYKFKVKPREQFSVISKIPYVKNFLTTTCDYLIKIKHV